MDLTTQSGRAGKLRGKRLRVEVLLAGTTTPQPLPIPDLVEADLWNQRAFRCAGTPGVDGQYKWLSVILSEFACFVFRAEQQRQENKLTDELEATSAD